MHISSSWNMTRDSYHSMKPVWDNNSAGVLDEGWISWYRHKSTENPASISNILCETGFSTVVSFRHKSGTDRLKARLASNNITVENQAKKCKDAAARLRDKKTSHSLDKVLPLEKRLYLFYIKLKKTIFRSNQHKKNLARSVSSRYMWKSLLWWSPEICI